jgi:NAD+ kinase
VPELQYFVHDITEGGMHARRFRDSAPTTEDPAASDVILVFGGDGAMLHTIQRYLEFGKPFVGVNTGSRGYLMNNAPEPDRFVEHLPELRFQELWLLKGVVETRQGRITVYGFNDIWVERATSQILRMRLTVQGNPQPPLVIGDGMLFSTPQGSTGYNLALRGKPICPAVPVIQVTPMACVIDKSPLESFILSDRAVVSVDFEQIEKRPGRLFYDGIRGIDEAVTRLTVRRSERTVQLGFIEDYSCINRVLPWQLHY